MSHIDALTPFLGVNFDPSALKPLCTQPKIGPLGYGDVRAGVLSQAYAYACHFFNFPKPLSTLNAWGDFLDLADWVNDAIFSREAIALEVLLNEGKIEPRHKNRVEALLYGGAQESVEAGRRLAEAQKAGPKVRSYETI